VNGKDGLRAALVFVVVGLTMPSIAQESAASDQFTAGTQAFKAGRFREAALLFESAAKTNPHRDAWLAAAAAWKSADSPDRRATALDLALRLPAEESENAKSRDRKQKKIEEELGVLALSLGVIDATSTDSPSVLVDEGIEYLPPVRVFVLPGVHRVSLLRESHLIATVEAVFTNRGVKTSSELLSLAAPKSIVSDSSSESPSLEPHLSVVSTQPAIEGAIPARSRAGWFVASGGVAAGSIGAFVACRVLWNSARGAFAVYEAEYESRSVAERQGPYDELLRKQLWSNVLLATGIVLGVAAVGLIIRGLWPEVREQALSSTSALDVSSQAVTLQ
jgi:hypothetical protein